ncbi:MAG: LysM peptidoglycan-binding domain-containing protein, partial [Vicinamibacterales bacterium]
MRRFLACFALSAVVVGSPVALAAAAGGPSAPSLKGFGGLDSTYLPLEPVLGILALFAWVLWAYIAVAVLSRAVAVVIAHRTGHDAWLRSTDRLAPKPIRRLVDLAVGGAFLAASFTVGRASAWPAMARPSAVVAATVPAREALPKVHQQKEFKKYAVRPGDSLWAIAERELGSGFRWKEIFRLNRGRVFPDGRCLENPRLIHPGWT